MFFHPRIPSAGLLRCRAVSAWASLALAALVLCVPNAGALPRRLVLALDGVAYRDIKALQGGVCYTNHSGRAFARQAFTPGFFPASRMISTFPSASDVAWTEILGDSPLPGYQRTYYCQALNTEIFDDGVSSTVEYERQMTWQAEGTFRRLMGYVFPVTSFDAELNEMAERFLMATNIQGNFYALLRTTDDAQHLSGDIFALLCAVEKKLQEICTRYRTIEGRELEILILSDHGNNHAGPAKRVRIGEFLTEAGYRVSKSIIEPKDVVLPTAGIESWVELHNSPSETENLVRLLPRLEGVDIITACAPGAPGQFIVADTKGARARIDWDPERNACRYACETGDPLGYEPVREALSGKGLLDDRGFASADAWMSATLEHRYPLALERIVRGHTRAALNPATILISLDNHYVHADWLIKKGSEFVWFGGTHGALDDLNSDGMLMSNFAPTSDTSASRVAALYGGFDGLRDYRAVEQGAEWVSVRAEALAAINRRPLDLERRLISGEDIFLRVWSPLLAHSGLEVPVEITIRKIPRFLQPLIRRTDPKPEDDLAMRLRLGPSIALSNNGSGERAYPLPSALNLEPRQAYRISGRIRGSNQDPKIFEFVFHTDAGGKPVAY
jgi:hypothetical protein